MPVINAVPPEPPEPVPPTPFLCSWAIDTNCIPNWDQVTPDIQDLASTWAAEILWALTGRRYGMCPIVWRPCNPKCLGSLGYVAYPVGISGAAAAPGPWMLPFIDGAGIWRNCVCRGACSCRASCEIPFPTAVAAVTEVKVDGVVLPTTAYRLDVYRGRTVLVRTDGECWPDCQNMDLDDTEVGSFSVTYQPGEALPAAGAIAAGKLAAEFVKQCQGGDCVLPDQLVTLSRNGVEVQVADPQALLDAGLTGIEPVDLWIRSVNPAKLTQPSRVYSLDEPAARFTR